ncbi:hypothetical protein ABPG72_010752 [Tetrahymena utriculariae]
MNDNQSYHMKRSFKYMCFQNQAHHFNNLVNTKHCIENKMNSKSPVFKKISPSKQVGSTYKMNQKRRKEVDRTINIENQKLLKKLQEIMEPKVNSRGKHSNQDGLIYARLSSVQNRPRSNSKNSNNNQLGGQNNSQIINGGVTVGSNIQKSQSPSSTIRNTGSTINNFNHSVMITQNQNTFYNGTTNYNSTNSNFKNTITNTTFYNNPSYDHSKSKILNQTVNNFNSSYKRQSELNTIERENIKIAKKITECKPAVGTIDEWNQHYLKFKQNSTKRRIITTTGCNSAYESQSYLPQTSNFSPAVTHQKNAKPYICIPNIQNMQAQYQEFIKKNKLYSNGNQIDQQRVFMSHFNSASRQKQRNISAHTGSVNGQITTIGGMSQKYLQSPKIINGIYVSQSQICTQQSGLTNLNSSQLRQRSNLQNKKSSRDLMPNKLNNYRRSLTTYQGDQRLASSKKENEANLNINQDENQTDEKNTFNSKNCQSSENNQNIEMVDFEQIDCDHYNVLKQNNGYAFNNSANSFSYKYFSQQKVQSQGKYKNRTKYMERNLIDPRSIEFEKLKNSQFDFRSNKQKSNQGHANNIYKDNFMQQSQPLQGKNKRMLSELGFSDEENGNENNKQKQEDEISGLININMLNQIQNDDKSNIENSDNFDEKIKQIQEKYIQLDFQKENIIINQQNTSQTIIKNDEQKSEILPLRNSQDQKNFQLYHMTQKAQQQVQSDKENKEIAF